MGWGLGEYHQALHLGGIFLTSFGFFDMISFSFRSLLVLVSDRQLRRFVLATFLSFFFPFFSCDVARTRLLSLSFCLFTF